MGHHHPPACSGWKPMDLPWLFFPSPSPSSVSGSPVCLLQNIYKLSLLSRCTCFPFFMFQSMFLPSSKPTHGILSHWENKSQFPHNPCPVHLCSLISHHSPLLPFPPATLTSSQAPYLTPNSQAPFCHKIWNVLCPDCQTSFSVTSLRHLHEAYLLTYLRWTPCHCSPSPYYFILPHNTHYHLTSNLFICLVTVSPRECPLHGGRGFICCVYY